MKIYPLEIAENGEYRFMSMARSIGREASIYAMQSNERAASIARRAARFYLDCDNERCAVIHARELIRNCQRIVCGCDSWHQLDRVIAYLNEKVHFVDEEC